MFKHNVVALGLEGIRPPGGRGIIDLVDAVGRHLGDEHLRDECQALVDGARTPG